MLNVCIRNQSQRVMTQLNPTAFLYQIQEVLPICTNKMCSVLNDSVHTTFVLQSINLTRSYFISAPFLYFYVLFLLLWRLTCRCALNISYTVVSTRQARALRCNTFWIIVVYKLILLVRSHLEQLTEKQASSLLRTFCFFIYHGLRTTSVTIQS
jgi:hypothetical protein